MEALLSKERLLAATACVIGVAVSLWSQTPYGLLAPLAAIALFAGDRVGLAVGVLSAVGLAGSLIVVAVYAGAHDHGGTWAVFFATATCIGGLILARKTISPGASPEGTAGRKQGALYPGVGPTLEEKAAPRRLPWVGLSAAQDKTTADQLVAVSFWGGLPLNLQYWRQESNGRRWVESHSEAVREADGARRWRAATGEIDDQRPDVDPPSRIASSGQREDDAVRAAKYVERLIGNAWAFDAVGRPTYLTPLAQTFVAWTLEEFQSAVDAGHTFFKLTAHPDEYDRVSAAWRRSLDTGEAFFLDRRIRRAGGIHEWNRVGFVPTRDKEGRVTGWYGATIDLDSYRIAQAELRDRERELSQLVDMAPGHIWRITSTGEPVFFNKRLIDYLGFDLADVDGRGASRLEAVVDAVHPDETEAFTAMLADRLATGETFAMRLRLRRSDGSYRWMDCRGEPMRDDFGEIVQWFGVNVDIDDQMKAEESLRRRERELQEIIDAVPVRIWRAAPDDGPIYFNKRYQDHFRSVFGEFDGQAQPRIGQLLQQLVHPDDAPGTERTLGACFASGEGAVLRFRWREKGDAYRWAECRVESRRDDNGEVVQWYGASVDIDDEVRAQAELRRTQERLAQASQAASLAELSASIAHEVNQPLAAVVANSHACQRWLDADPPNLDRAQTTVERIIRDANGAAEVVSRIRALFRQSVTTRTGASLVSMIPDATRWIADQAARHGVLVNSHIDADVPLIAVDQVQVQQVLINLMRNAVEAMGANTGPRVLGVEVSRDGGFVRIAVRDTGPGVADADKVFDAFFTTKASGMGMGLAVCRSIVESHGGRLWTERNAQGGASFIFTLPIEATPIA